MAKPKPLAELLPACLGKAAAAQGFASTDILASWAEIVGEAMAARSQPLRIAWPRRMAGDDRRAEAATLLVRVESAFALDLQHLAPVVIERINAVYGWRCVGRITLKQGPVARSRPAAVLARPLAAAERQRLAEVTSGIAEEPLRSALDRLGSAVLTSG